MNKLNKILLYLLLSLSTTTAWAQKPTPEENQKNFAKVLDQFGASVSLTNRYFVDSINVKEMCEYGINAMLQSLDPYTEFYSKEDNERFKLMTTGEYGGIGAIIMQHPDSTVFINEPMEGMPADLAGLKSGDKILEINGKDFRHSTSNDVSKALKGNENSPIRILVQRYKHQEPILFKFKRKQIHLNAVGYYGLTQKGFGYIALNSFTKSAAEEVKKALLELKKEHNIKGLILDLRGNGGGLLDQAVKIVNLFVPKDELIVYTKARPEIEQDSKLLTTENPIAKDLPLVVLINGSSASASEIVAGSLQDLDRAVVLGQKSFGKGLVQSTLGLPHGGMLKLTTAKYYIPSGRCIQKINYKTRKNGHGEEHIPDSLAQTFYTRAGRPVKDVGGITPDITLKTDSLPTMLFYLNFDNKVFNWLTKYYYEHKDIASPQDFRLSKEDYQDFGKMLEVEKFNYDRQSAKALQNLKAIAELEGYYDKNKELFTQLENALKPNLHHDLQVLETKIKEYLEIEIIRRYYYKKGAISRQILIDKSIHSAEELLESPQKITKILEIPKSKSNCTASKLSCL